MVFIFTCAKASFRFLPSHVICQKEQLGDFRTIVAYVINSIDFKSEVI